MIKKCINTLKRAVCFTLFITINVLSICMIKAEVVNAATSTDKWKTSAVTLPVDGSLIGAGYIDVKWENTLEDVSRYDVYVDNVLRVSLVPASTSSMSYEFYTTEVKSHNAYVIAVLKDGTNVKSNVTTFYVTKKGICVNMKDMGTSVDPADMNIGWYYNWDYKSFNELGYSNKKFNNTEFVPMIYSDGMESIQDMMAYANEQGHKYMLSYNEPDLLSEANISPSSMILRWNDFVKYKGNMRLGSPATSTASSPVDPARWWQPYWNGLTGRAKNETSFIAIHKYYEYYDERTAYDFLMLIDETYAKYKKPIWVTEFALWRFDKNDAEGCAKAQEFMKIVCKGLNERSYVERYAWFCPNYRETVASSSAIFDYETGEITPIGKIYAEIGNPKGYKAKTYGVSANINKDTSIAACIAGAERPQNVITKARKKSFKYDISSVKRASGYQIRYGTKKNFKNAKIKTVKKTRGVIKIKFTKKQKKMIKRKKQKNIKYYVSVRAYKVLDGEKYYCNWSSRKTVKVKTK